MEEVLEEIIDSWLSESASALTESDDDLTESVEEFSSDEEDDDLPELSSSRQFLTASSAP